MAQLVWQVIRDREIAGRQVRAGDLLVQCADGSLQLVASLPGVLSPFLDAIHSGHVAPLQDESEPEPRPPRLSIEPTHGPTLLRY